MGATLTFFLRSALAWGCGPDQTVPLLQAPVVLTLLLSFQESVLNGRVMP